MKDNKSNMGLALKLCPKSLPTRELKKCTENLIEDIKRSADRRPELKGHSLIIKDGEPEEGDLLIGTPEDILWTIEEMESSFPAILILPGGEWKEDVRKACADPRLSVECILRGDRLGLGTSAADASEIALLQGAVITVFRRRCRSVLAERELSKPIDWKARLKGKSGEEAGFFSFFADPATRGLLSLLKTTVRELRGRIKDIQPTMRKQQESCASWGIEFKDLSDTQNKEHYCKETLHPIPSVLLLGESGTGKTLVSHWIAQALFPDIPLKSSSRHAGISSVPSKLIDSFLFGIVDKFASDVRENLGLFLSSRGKVVCLDEIGDMLPEHQTRLLTFLDTGLVTPVGWNQEPFNAPVVVVAATNRPIKDWISSGDERFRGDLYNRFSHVIEVPPLRERIADRRLLISLILQNPEINEPGSKVKRISLDAIEELENRDFPGNFRELQRILRSSVSLAAAEGSDTLCLRHLLGN